MNKNEDILKFIAISGTTGATENLYVYENKDTILIVDCGVGFPDSDMYGVDLVLPDFSYLLKNKKKIKGLVVTHGHEDHLGAIPYLLQHLETKIYATKLTKGFIEEKFRDHEIKQKVQIFDPDRDKLKIGSFMVEAFRISHSVPDGVGLAIHTSQGVCFHVADYKLDWTPVDQKPFDVRKLARLASKDVLLLASDSLGATTPGHTQSESVLESKIESIVQKSKGRVFITTVSSNISRMQQIMNIAERDGRKVAFVGRSVTRKADIAQQLGYLHYPKNLVIDAQKASRLKDSQIIYIIAGCYGQPGSGLYKAVMGEHRYLKIKAEDTVIFSADPAPPGSKVMVDFLVDKLFELNTDVHYYDLQENLHVSGHGSIEDIKFLMGVVKPRYYIPIGGTVRHMHSYRKIAVSMGAQEKQVFELLPGSVVEFENKKFKNFKKINVKEVLVDGLGVGDVGSTVLRDRQKLSEDGFVVVLITLDRQNKRLVGKPDFITRGFVFEKTQKDILDKASASLNKSFQKLKSFETQNIKSRTIDVLEKFFYEEIERRPMILPVVIET